MDALMSWLGGLGEAWWREWWAWGIGAALFGILELLAPGYIFLGFAIGAGAMAAIFLVGDPVAAWLPEPFAGLVLTFAILSILAWVAMRQVLGVRKGQYKTFDRDINED